MRNPLAQKCLTSFSSGLAFPFPYIVPVYHSVSDDYLPHLAHIIKYKSIKSFKTDLEFLSKKFEFVDWDYFKNNYHTSRKKPVALLTFDDGFIEFREIILPILLEKGIYAINFVNPAFVSQKEIMFRLQASIFLERFNKLKEKKKKFFLDELKKEKLEIYDFASFILNINYNSKDILKNISKVLEVDFQEYILNRKVYMDEADLQYSKNQGFGIAAHSWDHPYFYDIPKEKQLESAIKSIEYCKREGYLGDTFAFPFTDVDVSLDFFTELFAVIPEMKISFGTSGLKLDTFPKNLHRIAMEREITAEKELLYETNAFYIKKILGKTKYIRQ